MDKAKGLLHWAIRQVVFLLMLGSVLFLSARICNLCQSRAFPPGSIYLVTIQ